MGWVDRLDKNISLSRLRLKRCMKRYHRALFVWYIAAILNNIMSLFGFLFSDIDELRKSKQRIGYKHWFQNALGNGLIQYGIKLATENLARAATASAVESRSVRLPTVTTVSPVTPSSTNINRRSSRGNVLRNSTNSIRPGRPFKRTRGRNGGRPRTAVCVSFFTIYFRLIVTLT